MLGFLRKKIRNENWSSVWRGLPDASYVIVNVTPCELNAEIKTWFPHFETMSNIESAKYKTLLQYRRDFLQMRLRLGDFVAFGVSSDSSVSRIPAEFWNQARFYSSDNRATSGDREYFNIRISRHGQR